MTILVFLLLFILPQVYVPLLNSYFEPPKVIIAEVLIQIMAILAIITKQFKLSLRQLLVGSLFILSLIHLLLGEEEMFFGNAFRLQGIFLLWHLLVFFLISSKLRVRLWTKGVWVAYLLLFASIWLFGGNEEGRKIGSLGEPNSLATTFLFMFPLVFISSKIYIKIISLLIIVIAVYFTGSYSAVIALSIELLFLSLIKFKLNLKSALIISLFLSLLTMLLPFLQVSKIYENRAEIWQTALVAGWDQPIIGNGFGNITNSLKEASWKISNNIRFQFVDSSHNILLDYWVQGGLVGLIIFISLLTLSIKNLIRKQETVLLTAFLGILLMFLFNPLSVVNLIELWWLIGQGFDNHPHIS